MARRTRSYRSGCGDHRRHFENGAACLPRPCQVVHSGAAAAGIRLFGRRSRREASLRRACVCMYSAMRHEIVGVLTTIGLDPGENIGTDVGLMSIRAASELHLDRENFVACSLIQVNLSKCESTREQSLSSLLTSRSGFAFPGPASRFSRIALTSRNPSAASAVRTCGAGPVSSAGHTQRAA